MEFITEPARQLPVVGDFDLVVIGGSCTGVFAAVRAARLGLKTALIEKSNWFGGTATSGLVCIWHSCYDTTGKEQIIAGLTQEVTASLLTRKSAIEFERTNPSSGLVFNPMEMVLVLDKLVTTEKNICPFLHTRFCATQSDNNKVTAAIIENKDGRSAIKGKVFIDATGDGDLAAMQGLNYKINDNLQPPTTTAILSNFYRTGLDSGHFRKIYAQHHKEFDLPADSGWSCRLPNHGNLSMFAEGHVFNHNCADASQLTAAEIEGRRMVDMSLQLMQKYAPQDLETRLVSLCSHIGIRETRRFDCDYTVTEADILSGRKFTDTIGHGTYRVDIHNPTGGGFIFKYLDGRLENGAIKGRWRDPLPEDPTYYNIPYSCLVSKELPNVILAGRMLSADRGAYGALRVMVNLNQTGEAAGVAAALSLREKVPVNAVNIKELQQSLISGGSFLHKIN